MLNSSSATKIFATAPTPEKNGFTAESAENAEINRSHKKKSRERLYSILIIS
jgi:hypothetical protein